jgi:predicted DNA-binding transcriptional regulator YafY
VDESSFSKLNKAFARKRRMDVKYLSSRRKHFTNRQMDIYYLNRKYVIAFDDLSGEVRKFRTGRFVDVKILNVEYEVPRNFDENAYL